MEELRGVLRCHQRRSIKDFWRSKMPDVQLRWTAIRGAINLVSDARSGLWSLRVREGGGGGGDAHDGGLLVVHTVCYETLLTTRVELPVRGSNLGAPIISSSTTMINSSTPMISYSTPMNGRSTPILSSNTPMTSSNIPMTYSNTHS